MSQLPLPPALAVDLESVDAIIRERIEPRLAVVRVAGQHALGSGGGRGRAALALLAAQLGRYDTARVLHSAAAVELIYAASQVHDDLIEESERRDRVVERARWQGDVALMVGDYLFALAAAEMALAPDPRIIAYFSRAVMTICEGELAPLVAVAPRDEAVEQYLYKIGCKTAALFEAACKAGMVCGDGTQEQVDALGRFGYDLGLAFQIAEDVRDLSGEGAPARSLQAGAVTLPLIYAAAADEGLATLLDHGPLDDGQVSRAAAAIRRASGDARALADARSYFERALAQLALFPASPARDALERFARFLFGAT